MSTSEQQRGLAAPVVVSSLLLAIVAAFALGGRASADQPHHAGLVVDFGDGYTVTRCVEFTEEEISGTELLQRSGLTLVLSDYGGLGTAVCRIGDTGCSDPGDCFCQCRGAECAHWSYYALEDGEWDFQNSGASQRHLRDGDVDGWIWGGGRTPPARVTFGEVCPLAVPTSPPAPPTPPPASVPGAQSDGPDTATGPAAASGPNEPPPDGQDDPASVPASTASAEGAAEPVTSGPAAAGTPQGTEDARQVAGAARGGLDGAPVGSAGLDPATGDETGGGVPVGLIAFGAVAGVLAGGIGGVALWRRRVG